jgi:hypothetical protein
MALADDIIRTISQKAATAGSTNNSNVDSENRALQLFRTPFIMSCKSWDNATPKRKIVFRCNPGQVNYEFTQRGGTQDVKSGKVFYFWRNRDKQSHWDLPSFTFHFQSGNIRPMIEKGDDVYLPEGLNNFYTYMDLIDEVKLLPDGSPNWITIVHHSNIFPSLYLEGFFDPATPLTFDETAEAASLVEWQGKFLIHYSNPAFNSTSFSNFSNIFKSTWRGNSSVTQNRSSKNTSGKNQPHGKVI